MKKLSSIFVVALMAVTLFSCNKKDDVVAPQQYASFVSGQFLANDGDITLKSAPLVGGHVFDFYKKADPWSLIDGSEFLPGSAPALDWTGNFEGKYWFAAGQGIWCTYCPVLPLRVVIKATEGAQGSTVSYLGIKDVTPNAASFPITVQDRRLGDKLTLNTDALTALPGYTNLSFSVSYDKSIIDIDQTAMTSPATDVSWPEYKYSGVASVVDQLVTGAGDVTVYDGLDAKITGTITIKINVDNTTITKTVDASELGHGMAITLKTTKVGWYDSGIIGITDTDVETLKVDIDIN
jgi:hypothetical protein